MRRNRVRENGESSGSSESLHGGEVEKVGGWQETRLKADLGEHKLRCVPLLIYRPLSRLRIISIAKIVNYGRRPYYSLVLTPHLRNIVEGEGRR